ncbi:MAG: hypothetical protein H0T42_06735 [Deltaproteobacteria bacterium]|nr:hypothetical protein [Deltaproteobacteria bacterium]
MASKPPRTLVIAQDPGTHTLVERVTRDARQPIRLTSVLEVTADGAADVPLLVLGEPELTADLPEHIEKLRAGGPTPMLIALIDESQDRRAALDRVLAQHIDHLIPSAAIEDLLLATLRKLDSGEYFGLEYYLRPGIETLFWTLGASHEKAVVLDEIKKIAGEVKCHPRITDLLVTAVDEMIINALYRPDPAAEEAGQSSRPVTVACGCDGRFLAVSVLDEYGRFRHQDLVDAIRKALEHEQHGIAETAAHASLGFRLMLGALSHLVINVDPGRRTEIIGLVDLRRSLKDHRSAVPGLGMFT